MASNYANELHELDKRHFLHPWTHFASFREEGSLVVESGEGCYVRDTEGRRYLDAVGGLWCNNIGLGRAEMAEAIAAQVLKMSYASPFTDMSNAPAIELAAKLVQLAPGALNHVFYSTGGSTAVDTAFRMIQFYQSCRGQPDKRHIISRRSAYHGSTYASMSIGGKQGDRVPEFSYITDIIHHISAPNRYRAPAGMDEAAFLDFLVGEFEDKINEIGAERVAAFFAEPVMGAGGVIVPPVGYAERMLEVCRKHDVLFVADEVVTAFGRLGHWFASRDEFEIEPDIITCAKGLSSGYLPIGATLYSDQIHDTISQGSDERMFAHGFTYSGHAVCCAAALKNIEIIEREDLLAHVREVGPLFEQRLQRLADLPIVGEVRGMKLMMCVENVKDKETRALFPEHIDVGKRIASKCDAMGLIVRPIGHLNVMSPPLVITEEQIDFIADTLEKGIRAVVDELNREGVL